MNRGSDSILSVYSDARAEYTKQLCVFLVPAYFQFYVELLEKAKQAMATEPKKGLWQFQNYLNEVHDWNMEKVNTEIHQIHANSGCDYMEDLLTAVFIAHTKVLTAIRLSASQKKVEINIPKVEHFLFKVLCETSKLLWSSTYLFREGIPAIEKQQNYRMIEGILNEGILQAVRSLVPVKSILKDFVNSDMGTSDLAGEKEDEDSEDEEEKKEALNVAHNVAHNVAPKPVKEEVKEQPMEAVKEQPVEALNAAPNVAPNAALNAALNVVPKLEELHIQEPVSQLTLDAKEEEPMTIVIEDEKPTVRFGQFDAVFDSEHPDASDMIYDPKEKEDPVELDLLGSPSTSLSQGVDFDDLEAASESIESGDYEEL